MKLSDPHRATGTPRAADVAMADGLSGADIALALARTRAAIATELPVIARLYLTPVIADP